MNSENLKFLSSITFGVYAKYTLLKQFNVNSHLQHISPFLFNFSVSFPHAWKNY